MNSTDDTNTVDSDHNDSIIIIMITKSQNNWYQNFINTAISSLRPTFWLNRKSLAQNKYISKFCYTPIINSENKFKTWVWRLGKIALSEGGTRRSIGS